MNWIEKFLSNRWSRKPYSTSYSRSKSLRNYESVAPAISLSHTDPITTRKTYSPKLKNEQNTQKPELNLNSSPQQNQEISISDCHANRKENEHHAHFAFDVEEEEFAKVNLNLRGHVKGLKCNVRCKCCDEEGLLPQLGFSEVNSKSHHFKRTQSCPDDFFEKLKVEDDVEKLIQTTAGAGAGTGCCVERRDRAVGSVCGHKIETLEMLGRSKSMFKESSTFVFNDDDIVDPLDVCLDQRLDYSLANHEKICAKLDVMKPNKCFSQSHRDRRNTKF